VKSHAVRPWRAGAIAVFLSFGFAAPLFNSTPAHAQATIAEVANLSGPDRTQKLIKGAKKEGTLTLYSTTPPADANATIAAFQKKYGVKVQLWRASMQDVMNRATTEARAGLANADVYESSGVTIEVLHREKLLQPIKSPVNDDLIPEARSADGAWVATRLNLYAAMYNTNIVKKADLPKSYDDLADPKWKGKLAIDTESFDWLATLALNLGEQKTLDLFRKIVATNGVSVRKGHTLLANLVAAGEIPLALTAYDYRAKQLVKEGAPVDYFFLKPTLALPVGVGVSNKARHPYAAALYYDFLLTDTQKIYLDRNYFVVNRKVKEPPADLSLKLIDYKAVLDDSDKWNKVFADIFHTR